MHNRKQDQDGRSPPQKDMEGGFATTAAAMIAMLAAPALNEITAPYVIWLAQKNYSQDFVELIAIAWMIACFPFVFFSARAGIVAAITISSMYVSYRVFI